jgi:hypothetical protein
MSKEVAEPKFRSPYPIRTDSQRTLKEDCP